jgi:magnesium transporter
MRRRRHHGLPSNPGTSPGTLVMPEGAREPRVRLVRYDARQLDAREHLTAADVLAIPESELPTWLEVEGYGDLALLEAIERRFGVPRLALEDVLGNCARPKLELFDGGLFIVARASKAGERPEFEQISIFVRGRTVVTFVDEPLDVLAPLRARLQDPASLTRRSAIDFLVYRVLDSAVDTFVPCLESLGARLDAVEAEAIARPSSRPLHTLYRLMRDLRQVTRVALPMRELAGSLIHEARPHFQASTLPFMADLRDHTQGVVEMTAHYRDLGTDVRELIHGALNLRLNQVMRMLTAITSVFIPLSFVTGVYGMNFEHMPETSWRWGYPLVLGILLATALFIVHWLRRQGWTKVGDE